ncbi:MAG: hypothetical protein U1C48_12355 [Methylotenera sp.]|nr:hypothetical protein [Methylotenera sp.]
MQVTAKQTTPKNTAKTTPAKPDETNALAPGKPVEFEPAKENSLARLLASCCDCV